jgi:hypothetical protein
MIKDYLARLRIAKPLLSTMPDSACLHVMPIVLAASELPRNGSSAACHGSSSFEQAANSPQSTVASFVI